MATRSLTEVFILMRNNAIQHRQFFPRSTGGRFDSEPTDKTGLMSEETQETRISMAPTLPPEWTDSVEDVQYNVSKIQQRLKELQSMHDKHIHRPSLDDDLSTDHGIEALTQEITQMFLHCQKQINTINRAVKDPNSGYQDGLLAKNVVSSLASTLQDLSITFRQGQSNYLNKVKSREERSRLFSLEPLDAASALGDDPFASQQSLSIYDRGFNDPQMQVLMENTNMVEEREREISNIVQSITDLNLIFKDLAQMIVDQGTVLDRIDYNIEHSATNVTQGLKQLQKAEAYQKKNNKMVCIVVLGFVVIVLLVLLVMTKF